MEKNIFKISDQITIEEINKLYEINFEKIIFEFFNLENDWMFNAYKEYKDFDKYIILVYLVNKTLQTYNKHFYKVNFEKFYNSSHIEIEKISIIDLVNTLSISKETARRKINELSAEGVLTRKLKNIRINKVSLNNRLERNVFNLSKILFLATQKLNKEHGLQSFTQNMIEKKIRENYTQYWSLFFKFQIPYILRCKKVYSTINCFYIWGLCALNEAYNSKNLDQSVKDNMFLEAEEFHYKITKLKSSLGLNPTTIAELSGIPRATVIRQIKYLVNKNFLYKEKQLYKINNNEKLKSFHLQNNNFKKNQYEFRIFLKEILNLIKIG